MDVPSASNRITDQTSQNSESAVVRNGAFSQMLGADAIQNRDDTKLGSATVVEIDKALGAHKKSAAETEELAKKGQVPPGDTVAKLDDATQQDKQFKPQDALAASAVSDDQSQRFNQIFANPGDTSQNSRVG